jgi:hypothetical protein
MKMEAICSSETSVDFQQTTRCYIPENSALIIIIIIITVGFHLMVLSLFRFPFCLVHLLLLLQLHLLIFRYHLILAPNFSSF